MNAIKLTLLGIAVVIGIPAASTFAAQQFGRDSVYVQPGQTVRSAPATVEVKRFGRDSVFITKDTVLTPPSATKFSNVVVKAGRA
jgi:hypothetical protein